MGEIAKWTEAGAPTPAARRGSQFGLEGKQRQNKGMFNGCSMDVHGFVSISNC